MKDKIVVDGVTYFREDVSISQEVSRKAGNYDWLVSEINNYHEDALSLYVNMKNECLSINMVEAEGFLRAMKTIINKIGEIEDSDSVDW